MDADWSAFDVESVAFGVFKKEFFVFADGFFCKRELFVTFVVHEVVFGAVIVEVLAFFALSFDSFDGFARAESVFDNLVCFDVA